jgi:hypothetical protein
LSIYELRKVRLKATYSGLRELWLSRTALAVDIVESMLKVKTNHWAGVTLPEKHVRDCAGHAVRLALESAALERHPRSILDILRDRSDALRDRGRNHRHGR